MLQSVTAFDNLGRSMRRLKVEKLDSLFFLGILLFSVISLGFNGLQGQLHEAHAQEEETENDSMGPLQVTVTYSYDAEFADSASTRTILETYSGLADLYSTEGGFEGNSKADYHYSEDFIESAPGCDSTIEYHTTTFGQVNMVVHYQYSIDNPVTGGPDTSMYDSAYGVVEVLFDAQNLDWRESNKYCEGDSYSDSGQDGAVGFGCFFYSTDFDKGGVFTSRVDVTDDTSGTCTLTIGQSTEILRIFGTSVGDFGRLGMKGLPNSKVVIAELDNHEFSEPALSKSKPAFFSETLTSDNDDAGYEFQFVNDDPSTLPKILVVSLLWYGGTPEFAVTNGKNSTGIYTPVYQALCVDDEDFRCEKWERTANGYEAEVDFEFGSQAKLDETSLFMDLEELEGIDGPRAIMNDAAYIYYNSYLAVKYFETLGLPRSLEPVMIQAHHKEGYCPGSGAYFDAPAKLDGKLPSFGDLGTFLKKIQATGSGVYICDSDSIMGQPDAPVNREWHELGHYLMFQLYDNPYLSPNGDPHTGYANENTNQSLIEGFAEFIALLIQEYIGEPRPYTYPVGTSWLNLDDDYKVWGNEEFAVAGILWDIHDPGNEVNNGFYLNGQKVDTTNLWSGLKDTMSMDASEMITKIDNEEPKTLFDLGKTFGVGGKIDVFNIFVNHGGFPDIKVRDHIFEYTSEEEDQIGQTGSLSDPARLVRYSPVPKLPGSYLVSEIDATFNMTINHIKPFENYDYSYLVEMEGGKATYFVMPPEYYPSTLSVTPINAKGEPLTGGLVIESRDYWDYISSNPGKDETFAEIPVGGELVTDTNTAIEYIQAIKDLLEKASFEYKDGNATGAVELARIAYLDNFEYIEPELEERNATELKEMTEKMLREELVALIRDKANPEVVDAKIAEINANLDVAATIVPEFPVGLSIVIVTFALMSVLLLGRFRKDNWQL